MCPSTGFNWICRKYAVHASNIESDRWILAKMCLSGTPNRRGNRKINKLDSDTDCVHRIAQKLRIVHAIHVRIWIQQKADLSFYQSISCTDAKCFEMECEERSKHQTFWRVASSCRFDAIAQCTHNIVFETIKTKMELDIWAYKERERKKICNLVCSYVQLNSFDVPWRNWYAGRASIKLHCTSNGEFPTAFQVGLNKCSHFATSFPVQMVDSRNFPVFLSCVCMLNNSTSKIDTIITIPPLFSSFHTLKMSSFL